MATGRIGTTPVLTTRWSKQPAAGTTSLSGLDDNSVSLVYSVGYEAVYRNGTLLSRGNDYTATNGTTITLVDATLTGDIIEVFANQTVPLTDTYSQTVANSLFVNQATFDAKGDLIAGTADNAYTKLSVGSNGETLVADSSTSTGLRYNPQNALANPVINGGMDVWQRGTSMAGATGAGSGFAADRWIGGRAAFVAGQTTSRQSVSDSTNLPTIQYGARVQRDSGNTATQGLNLTHNLESINSIPFAGRTVTLSFYARAGANFSSTSNLLQATLATGTGTDQNYYSGAYTGQATPIQSNVTLTTTWQRFALSATLSSSMTEMAIAFNYIPTGTAGANDWFEVTGVQIDLGTYTASSAPAFRRSGGTLAGELSACERYYQRFENSGTGDFTALGVAYTTAKVIANVKLKTTMRTAPTSIDYSSLRVYDYVNPASTVTAVALATTTKDYGAIELTVASGLTLYRTYTVLGNTLPSYYSFSAEL